MLFGVSAVGWAAIGSVATALLVAVALWQLLLARFENKKTQTLAACTAYDMSENIYDATNKIWRAREDGSLDKNPRAYRPQINLILNHLDAVAIGIDQRLYIESLAYDHLNGIVQRHVATFVDSGIIDKVDLSATSYTNLIDLRNKWARAKPRFRDGMFWQIWRYR